MNPGDLVIGGGLLVVSVWWLAAGWRRASRNVDAALATLDQPSRDRHPSSRRLP